MCDFHFYQSHIWSQYHYFHSSTTSYDISDGENCKLLEYCFKCKGCCVLCIGVFILAINKSDAFMNIRYYIQVLITLHNKEHHWLLLKWRVWITYSCCNQYCYNGSNNQVQGINTQLCWSLQLCRACIASFSSLCWFFSLHWWFGLVLCSYALTSIVSGRSKTLLATSTTQLTKLSTNLLSSWRDSS